tara:strand:- start:3239 stop:3370 length:132 start_codon:yes stop_codon:yes gene_type:complete
MDIIVKFVRGVLAVGFLLVMLAAIFAWPAFLIFVGHHFLVKYW